MSPVRPLCLLWIAFHIGRRPRPNVHFTVRDILFCRRFKCIDSYKRTSPRGPAAKHLRPRLTPINGVYATGRLSSHSPFSQMYVRAAAERSLSGTPMHLLLVDAPNRAVPITECSMHDWSLYALWFLRTLWTGYCEFLRSAVAL